jgi:PAS domain S-box-containing protein
VDQCPRCNACLVPDAKYCHACGVSLTAAVSGEYELYDVGRFFTHALDLFCIAGTDGFFKRVNPAFERVLGYSPKELLGEPFVDFIHPEDRTDTLAEVSKLASGALTLSFHNRFRCKDGSYKRLHWTSYPEQGTGPLYAVAREVPESD